MHSQTDQGWCLQQVRRHAA